MRGTTGTGMFAPYFQPVAEYWPEADLALFVLIDETVTDIERVVGGISEIGKWGFGKDASIGKGRFTVKKADTLELALPKLGETDAIYTLAPSVPPKQGFETAWFTPFTRFGKFGDRLAKSGPPFKNPAIMADEGAVFKPKDRAALEKNGFFGSAVTGLCGLPGEKNQETPDEKIRRQTVAQGAAPFLPLRMQGE